MTTSSPRPARRTLGLLPLLTLLCCALAPTPARAEDGWRSKLELAFRSTPLGLSLFNDTGYRKMLSPSESLLLNGTYIEGGAHTIVSPTYFRTGGYLEFLPLSVLQLRSNVQYARYHGNFGFLYESPDQDDPSWTLDDLKRVGRQGTGTAGDVLFIENTLTPRAKLGRVVALLPFSHLHVRSSLERPYYEPFYDIVFNPTDNLLAFKPTLGILPVANDDTYLLAALHYEKTWALGRSLDSDLASVLLIWGLPKRWVDGNTITLTALGGYWLTHPEGRAGSTYVAFKLGSTFGAQ